MVGWVNLIIFYVHKMLLNFNNIKNTNSAFDEECETIFETLKKNIPIANSVKEI